MCGWTGHLQGNLALRVCEPLCGECAVQRQILSPGGYQGEGMSVPRMRAEMGSPWSVALLRHAGRAGQTCPVFVLVSFGEESVKPRFFARLPCKKGPGIVKWYHMYRKMGH